MARKRPFWIFWHRGHVRTYLILAGCLLAKPALVPLLVGVGVILLGAVVHIWAKGCLRIGQELATSGPYRWVRNPFYLANIIIETGIAISTGQPWIIPPYLALWFFSYLRTIASEEEELAHGYGGEQWAAYKKAVPKLFPWKGPARGLAPSQGFSWSNPNLSAGMEYARVIRVLYAPFLIWAVNLALRKFVFKSEAPEIRTWEWALLGGLAFGFLLQVAILSIMRRRKKALQADAQPGAATAPASAPSTASTR